MQGLALLFSDQFARPTSCFVRSDVVICRLGNKGSLLAQACRDVNRAQADRLAAFGYRIEPLTDWAVADFPVCG